MREKSCPRCGLSVNGRELTCQFCGTILVSGKSLQLLLFAVAAMFVLLIAVLVAQWVAQPSSGPAAASASGAAPVAGSESGAVTR
jgi:hypothetical protein